MNNELLLEDKFGGWLILWKEQNNKQGKYKKVFLLNVVKKNNDKEYNWIEKHDFFDIRRKFI